MPLSIPSGGGRRFRGSRGSRGSLDLGSLGSLGSLALGSRGSLALGSLGSLALGSLGSLPGGTAGKGLSKPSPCRGGRDSARVCQMPTGTKGFPIHLRGLELFCGGGLPPG